MSVPTEAASGPIISGFQAIVIFVGWSACVLLYGLYRSFYSPEPDPIRDAGPVGASGRN